MLKTLRKAVVASTNPQSLISEQFRTLRTNLYYSSIEDKDKTYVITSPNRGEGKTTTASNLAISMAQKGEEVLLVDASFHRPLLHNVFNLRNDIGLSNLLKEKSSIMDAVQPSGIEKLTVITNGQSLLQPADVLGYREIEDFLEMALERFDRIVFDTPSILESPVARIIANQCDGTLMVIQVGKTDSQKAMEAKQLLELVKVKLKGLILREA